MAHLTPLIPPSPLKSIPNFRDVAQTINSLPPSPSKSSSKPSPRLKPHLLYRSARPDSATPQDRLALTQTYGIKTILDLRSKSEHLDAAEKFSKTQQQALSLQNIPQAAVKTVENDLAAADETVLAPPPPPVSDTLQIPGIKYVEIDLHGSTFIRHMFFKLSWSSMTRLLYLMALGYRNDAIKIWASEIMNPRGMIGLFKDCLDYSQAEIGGCFKVLAGGDGDGDGDGAVLVHCTQGKDRTGLIVILVLMLLGVGEEAVEADYLVSERELEGEREGRMEEFRRVGLGEEFSRCPEGFVGGVREHLERGWGGVEGYLEGCGVDSRMREKIRWRFLEEEDQ